MTLLVIGAMLVLSGAGGWPLVAGILHLAARSADSGGQQAQEGADEAPDRSGALRGGTWIGVLERLAVTATLAAGFPEGVAIVVAIKGLGRFSELAKNPDSSERFVIGTLASLLWAGVVGGLARVYLG
ncbi:hypothetical protein [Actinotalea sp.]|uniref:hypothetical protein n=1 Tax=Actinotalea sp. TaxID=1872145 RepID=UPI0035620519